MLRRGEEVRQVRKEVANRKTKRNLYYRCSANKMPFELKHFWIVMNCPLPMPPQHYLTVSLLTDILVLSHFQSPSLLPHPFFHPLRAPLPRSACTFCQVFQQVKTRGKSTAFFFSFLLTPSPASARVQVNNDIAIDTGKVDPH